MLVLFLNGHPVWSSGLPVGLRRLGDHVKVFDKIEMDYLENYLKTYHPELVISVGWNPQYTCEKLTVVKEAVRKYNCVQAYWATEDINYIEEWSIPLVKILRPDVVFTVNAECIARYSELGFPAFHLDFAANPAYGYLNHREINPDLSHDIALVANPYTFAGGDECFKHHSFNILAKPLLEQGYDIKLWGNGWREAVDKAGWQVDEKQIGGPLRFEDALKVFRNSKIILNVQNQDRFDTQVTSRTYEICGCGAFQLTARTPAVQKVFTDRYHLAMSGSAEETLELVDFYLVHGRERREVATNGFRETVKKHTYVHRAKEIKACLTSLGMLK